MTIALAASSAYQAASTTTATRETSSTSSTAASSTAVSVSDFLSLIVQQLQNQNPLDPTDTNTFMQQMLSYAGYSKTTEIGDTLTSLQSSVNGLLANGALGYIGKTVEAVGDTTTLTDGKASFGYVLDGEASDVTVTIKDADGNVVWTGDGTGTDGKNSVTWDGVTTDGEQLTSGTYTISVKATDADGASVLDYTTVSGKVTAVDSSSGSILLTIAGVDIAFDKVVAITS